MLSYPQCWNRKHTARCMHPPPRVGAKCVEIVQNQICIEPDCWFVLVLHSLLHPRSEGFEEDVDHDPGNYELRLADSDGG
jgi:hypothetical protein